MIPPLESRQQTMIEASFIGNFVLLSNHSFLFSAADGFVCVCRLDDTSIHELSFGKKTSRAERGIWQKNGIHVDFEAYSLSQPL